MAGNADNRPSRRPDAQETRASDWLRRAAEWWRRWIPRPETTLLVLALAWTVGAKLVVVLRHAPSGFVASLAQVALPDVQFFAVIAASFGLLYRQKPRPWVARLTLLIACILVAWAVANAAWVVATGVQLQPGVLAALLRDPSQFWPIVQAHLEHKLRYAIPIGLTLLLAVLWLVIRLVRPVRIVLAPSRYARRVILMTAIAILSFPAQWSCHRRSILGFTGEVLGFSSHWQALVVMAEGMPQSPGLGEQTRSLVWAGERRVGAPDAARESLPDVVLVLLESFSYHSTSLGNPDLYTTPNLARLAREGAEFTLTRVPIAQTTKACWSALTGTMPDTGGIYVEAVPVDRPYEGMPSILARSGYRSAFFEMSKGTFECAPGLCANLAFDWAWFRENLEDPSAYLGYLGGDDMRVLDPMFEWIDGGSRPFFVMMITTVAHDPYDLPAWFAIPDTDRTARYRRAVEYTDYVLGELVDRLRRRGRYDNTILCLMGDHGVSERPDDRFGRWVPSEDLIRVPWVIRWPARVPAGTRVDWPCSQLDVTPTILKLVGLDISQAGFDGRDAFSPSDANRRMYFSSGFPNCPFGYLEGDRKWVYWRSNDRLFEYDLPADPNEQSPRVIVGPDRDRIVSDLQRWQQQWQLVVPARRFSERWVYDHWRTFSSGRSAWAYYVP